jgi:two-component system C4-dicarboxylate transport sensor histidine kinase DctB
MSEGHQKLAPVGRGQGMAWWVRLALGLVVLVAIGVILVTNRWMSERFTETTRNRADLRLAFYSGNILSELQRTSIVPLLLSNDPAIAKALDEGDFTGTSARLIGVQGEINAASIILLDRYGITRGSTDRNVLGTNHRARPYFVQASRSVDTVFTTSVGPAGGYDFTYSRAITLGGKLLGVIVVATDLSKYERAWSGLQDVVLVTDSENRVILATEPRWHGMSLEEVTTTTVVPSVFDRALEVTSRLGQFPPDAYLRGEAVLRTETRVPFQGWRMVSFAAYDSVRERVNGILALEIMGFAILMTITFYVLSRRAWSDSLLAQRESAELRLLNARLSREITERERVQKTLDVAELTLAQSSKLAVLGEMSAAVSHELNQPLAAMKTYLAGARLLLMRKRPEEALSSLQRIDDLIERMSAITRQLKSYARKGTDALEPVDLRQCLSAALSMMEPQLKVRVVKITRTLPRQPVMVMADRLRLEQVIINLLRNALDATKEVEAPTINLILTAGRLGMITVRDNGPGIKDFDSIFEPFYTTKVPGEGVGLGLAISSKIMSDLGGRLTARNVEGGGAEFEMHLPVIGAVQDAAE